MTDFPFPTDAPEPWYLSRQFTPTGIHIPTAEAFYLVLSQHAGLEPELVGRIMTAVDAGGPL